MSGVNHSDRETDGEISDAPIAVTDDGRAVSFSFSFPPQEQPAEVPVAPPLPGAASLAFSTHTPAASHHMAAALFYGECHREGIPPTAAERAAQTMSGRYQRWWVDAVATKQQQEKDVKDSTHETVKGNAGHKRPREESIIETPSSKKTRGVIERVSKRQEQQGGGYLYPRPPSWSSNNNHNHHDDKEKKEETNNPPPPEESHPKPQMTVAIDGQSVPIQMSFTTDDKVCQRTRQAKSQLLQLMAEQQGCVTSQAARKCLEVLCQHYQQTGADARSRRSALSGTWLALSQPAYNGCLGMNLHQHSLYTLGRMSFDMFRPTSLVCSIQANFSSIHVVEGPQGIPSYVPRRLKTEILKCSSDFGASTLRTYTITVAFCVEPNQTTAGERIEEQPTPQQQDDMIPRPIRGIMTNQGYMLPDPNCPNRMSIWFTEGTLEVNDDSDLPEWKRVFSPPHKRGLYERANILAARLLLGANVPDTVKEDGTMSYELRRPIGGHGLAFCDVLYLDEDLRVLRGHSGQVYVCARLAETQLGTDSPS